MCNIEYENWYYFVREGEGIRLVSRVEMPSRPKDAREGDEYTPWYREDEHVDGEHVHVKGEDEGDAYRRAMELISIHG